MAGTCTVNITKISDARISKESIDAEFPIASSPSEPWIESGFDRLKEYGFTVQRSAEPTANAINLNVRLIRAYTWFGNMRINDMVAIDIGMTSSDQHTEKFRATASVVAANSIYVFQHERSGVFPGLTLRGKQQGVYEKCSNGFVQSLAADVRLLALRFY